MASLTMDTLMSALFTGKTVLGNFCFSAEVARFGFNELKTHALKGLIKIRSIHLKLWEERLKS